MYYLNWKVVNISLKSFIISYKSASVPTQRHQSSLGLLRYTSITIYTCIESIWYILKHANHMTMTTSGQIMPCSDYLKTKGNVIIKWWDLCETLIVYIVLSTFQSVSMLLIVNKPDVRRFIAWIVSWLKPLNMHD